MRVLTWQDLVSGLACGFNIELNVGYRLYSGTLTAVKVQEHTVTFVVKDASFKCIEQRGLKMEEIEYILPDGNLDRTLHIGVRLQQDSNGVIYAEQMNLYRLKITPHHTCTQQKAA